MSCLGLQRVELPNEPVDAGAMDGAPLVDCNSHCRFHGVLTQDQPKTWGMVEALLLMSWSLPVTSLLPLLRSDRFVLVQVHQLSSNPPDQPIQTIQIAIDARDPFCP